MNMKKFIPHFDEESIEQDIEKGLEETRHSLAGFFVRKFRLTYLLLLVIILIGAYAITTLPKEAEPEVRVPFAVVTVAYPGANPTDVEELVVDKLEEKIKDLDNLKTYRGSAGMGVASVFVEFTAEADIDRSIDDLEAAVDEATPNLPEAANDPIVTEISFNDIPIVTYSLVGNYSDQEMKRYADRLQTAFEGMKDISKAPIIGGIEREYQILVRQPALATFNLSIGQVIQAISQSNINMPAGDIDINGYSYTVRVQGKFQDIEDINTVIVAYSEGAPIYIGDVAEILDTTKDTKSISTIGIGNGQPQNTVSIQIFKKTGGNILNIAEHAEKTIAELFESGDIPEDIDVVKTNDNSVYIKEDITRLGTSGIQTMFLIVLILFAVLGIRGALITGFSVPIAFLMAFMFIMWQGMTINSMVLFSLVLSLGLMVDNSIIVMEGINEYMHRYGKSPRDAALLSIWNYKWSIISGTMTTVAAFLPMLLVSGIMGEYMGILPKTITATLISSLFVALIIIPALCAKFYKDPEKQLEEKKHKTHRSAKLRHFIEKIQVTYVSFLRDVLPNKKKRRRAISIAIGLMVLTILLPITGIMKVNMFPAVDIDYFAVNIELPTGSTLEKTHEVTQEAEAIIRQIPELDNYVSSVGSGFSAFAGESAASGSHVASIVVNLVDGKERNRQSYEIADSIRPQLEAITSGTVRVEELTAGPPTGAPFEVRVFGDDLGTLTTLTEEIRTIAEQIPGLINVEDTIDESSGEFTFTIDRERVTYYGLNVGTVSQSIRQAIYGADATNVTVHGEDIDVTVKYDENSLQDANDLGNIVLLSPTVGQVPIRQVATLSLEPSVYQISHLDGEKVLRVRASTDTGADLRKITTEFNKRQKEQIELPEGYRIEVGGQTEDIQQSFTEIFLSFFVSLFLIILILVLQFDSFKKPFVIIFSLPLAIVGAFFGLTILGLDFSLPAFIGIVSLTGIVVNDAIVLIDRINKNLERNMDFFDGVIEAGVARTEPIFLTSITTIAGVFPLALSEAMWAGLGFSIIFGLLFSTVLVLVFIPIVFTSLMKKDYDKGKI